MTTPVRVILPRERVAELARKAGWTLCHDWDGNPDRITMTRPNPLNPWTDQGGETTMEKVVAFATACEAEQCHPDG